MDERVAPELLVFPDIGEAARSLAARIARSAQRSIPTRGGFSLVIPGGSTPRWLFDDLQMTYGPRIDWTHVDLYWSDERCVSPDDARSNYRLAAEHLLPLPGLSPSHIHRIEGELPTPELAAARCQADLFHVLGEAPGASEESRFDFTVLGIGPDGHTASLFPGSSTLAVTDRWAIVEPTPTREPRVPRVTLTLSALCRSSEVAFLAEGSEKAKVVAAVFGPPLREPELPSARVIGREWTGWYVDRAAAASAQLR